MAMPKLDTGTIVKVGGGLLLTLLGWWATEVNQAVAETSQLQREVAVIQEQVEGQQEQLDRIEAKLDRLLLESKPRPWPK